MTDLLEAAEWSEAVLDAALVAGWPAGDFDRLVGLGLLAEAGPAAAVACDACGLDHVEPVRWVGDPGPGRRAFIACPSVGPVQLDPAALRRWAVRLPALASAVADAVGPSGGTAEQVAGRVWKLGTLRAAGRAWAGFLAAGLDRPDAAAVVADVPGLRAANVLLFVPSAVPPEDAWAVSRLPAAVVPLCDLLTLRPDGLVADPAFLEAALPPAGKPAGKGPARAFPTPAGTTWERVTLTVEDLRVVVRVGDVVRSFGFADAGFEDRRKKGTPDEPWALLRLLARQRGTLGTGDRITTKPGGLKQKLSTLRDRLRALLGLDGDPFHPTYPGQPYRARFTVRSAGPAAIALPPGAGWDDVTITETADGRIEVVVTAEARGAADVRGEDEDGRRWEGTTGAGERRHRLALTELGLTGPDDAPTPAGEALVAVLRAGGRLTRPAGDPGLIALGGALSRFFRFDDPPFEFDDRRRQWAARFEALSLARPSDR